MKENSSSYQLHILTESPRWKRDLPRINSLVTKAVETTLDTAKWPPRVKKAKSFELNIVLTHDKAIQALNREYRNKDKPTNVLSFPLWQDLSPENGIPFILGDVILALETIVREAKDQNKKPADHVTHLVVHGVLHLLGYDHETHTQAAAMEKLEIRILKDLGVENPYVMCDAL